MIDDGGQAVGISAAVQHVRHIAALGLPGRMAVAAMVDALEAIVPTRTRTFIWANADGLPCDNYDRDLIPSAVDEYNALSPQLAADPNAPSLDKMLNSPDEYGGWRRFQALDGWDRSALKNIIFAAYGIGNNLDFPIRDCRGRSTSILTLGREPGSRAYTRREIAAVLSLRPHFLHVIDSQAALSAAEVCGPDGDVEIVLIGSDGTVCSASGRGESMLHQLMPAVRPVLKIRCDRAPPVVLAHLRSATGETVVSLQRLIPRELRRLRRAAALQISPREREIAVAMCRLGSGDAIARSVGLSASTYREYARRIYARLGVEGRAGVRELLDS
jgi:DNA-binding CsgD family transcriptional regulator